MPDFEMAASKIFFPLRQTKQLDDRKSSTNVPFIFHNFQEQSTGEAAHLPGCLV
jgi:hypothetical protein